MISASQNTAGSLEHMILTSEIKWVSVSPIWVKYSQKVSESAVENSLFYHAMKLLYSVKVVPIKQEWQIYVVASHQAFLHSILKGVRFHCVQGVYIPLYSRMELHQFHNTQGFSCLWQIERTDLPSGIFGWEMKLLFYSENQLVYNTEPVISNANFSLFTGKKADFPNCQICNLSPASNSSYRPKFYPKLFS